MHIGLTFDEYVDVKLRPPAGADPAIKRGFEAEVEEKFPMATVTASHHLRSRVRQPSGHAGTAGGKRRGQSWRNRTRGREDVDAAAEHFEEHEMFVPYAAMCQTLGCRYIDFLRPLREAAERESAKWGRAIPDSDQYFVMHRDPPRGDRDAVISFSLCSDIQERLERGEVV